MKYFYNKYHKNLNLLSESFSDQAFNCEITFTELIIMISQTTILNCLPIVFDMGKKHFFCHFLQILIPLQLLLQVCC